MEVLDSSTYQNPSNVSDAYTNLFGMASAAFQMESAINQRTWKLDLELGQAWINNLPENSIPKDASGNPMDSTVLHVQQRRAALVAGTEQINNLLLHMNSDEAPYIELLGREKVNNLVLMAQESWGLLNQALVMHDETVDRYGPQCTSGQAFSLGKEALDTYVRFERELFEQVSSAENYDKLLEQYRPWRAWLAHHGVNRQTIADVSVFGLLVASPAIAGIPVVGPYAAGAVIYGGSAYFMIRGAQGLGTAIGSGNFGFNIETGSNIAMIVAPGSHLLRAATIPAWASRLNSVLGSTAGLYLLGSLSVDSYNVIVDSREIGLTGDDWARLWTNGVFLGVGALCVARGGMDLVRGRSRNSRVIDLAEARETLSETVPVRTGETGTGVRTTTAEVAAFEAVRMRGNEVLDRAREQVGRGEEGLRELFRDRGEIERTIEELRAVEDAESVRPVVEELVSIRNQAVEFGRQEARAVAHERARFFESDPLNIGREARGEVLDAKVNELADAYFELGEPLFIQFEGLIIERIRTSGQWGSKGQYSTYNNYCNNSRYAYEGSNLMPEDFLGAYQSKVRLGAGENLLEVQSPEVLMRRAYVLDLMGDTWGAYELMQTVAEHATELKNAGNSEAANNIYAQLARHTGQLQQLGYSESAGRMSALIPPMPAPAQQPIFSWDRLLKDQRGAVDMRFFYPWKWGELLRAGQQEAQRFQNAYEATLQTTAEGSPQRTALETAYEHMNEPARILLTDGRTILVDWLDYALRTQDGREVLVIKTDSGEQISFDRITNIDIFANRLESAYARVSPTITDPAQHALLETAAGAGDVPVLVTLKAGGVLPVSQLRLNFEIVNGREVPVISTDGRLFYALDQVKSIELEPSEARVAEAQAETYTVDLSGGRSQPAPRPTSQAPWIWRRMNTQLIQAVVEPTFTSEGAFSSETIAQLGSLRPGTTLILFDSAGRPYKKGNLVSFDSQNGVVTIRETASLFSTAQDGTLVFSWRELIPKSRSYNPQLDGIGRIEALRAPIIVPRGRLGSEYTGINEVRNGRIRNGQLIELRFSDTDNQIYNGLYYFRRMTQKIENNQPVVDSNGNPIMVLEAIPRGWPWTYSRGAGGHNTARLISASIASTLATYNSMLYSAGGFGMSGLAGLGSTSGAVLGYFAADFALKKFGQPVQIPVTDGLVVRTYEPFIRVTQTNRALAETTSISPENMPIEEFIAQLYLSNRDFPINVASADPFFSFPRFRTGFERIVVDCITADQILGTVPEGGGARQGGMTPQQLMDMLKNKTIYIHYQNQPSVLMTVDTTGNAHALYGHRGYAGETIDLWRQASSEGMVRIDIVGETSALPFGLEWGRSTTVTYAAVELSSEVQSLTDTATRVVEEQTPPTDSARTETTPATEETARTTESESVFTSSDAQQAEEIAENPPTDPEAQADAASALEEMIERGSESENPQDRATATAMASAIDAAKRHPGCTTVAILAAGGLAYLLVSRSGSQDEVDQTTQQEQALSASRTDNDLRAFERGETTPPPAETLHEPSDIPAETDQVEEPEATEPEVPETTQVEAPEPAVPSTVPAGMHDVFTTTIQSFGLEYSDVSDFFEGPNFYQKLVDAGVSPTGGNHSINSYFGIYAELVQQSKSQDEVQGQAATNLLNIIEGSTQLNVQYLYEHPLANTFSAVEDYVKNNFNSDFFQAHSGEAGRQYESYNQVLLNSGASDAQRALYLCRYAEITAKARSATHDEEWAGAQDLLKLLKTAEALDESEYRMNPLQSAFFTISSNIENEGVLFYLEDVHSMHKISDELLTPAHGWYIERTDGSTRTIDGNLPYSKLLSERTEPEA
ncbi:hypothetical protein DRN67_01170 [Candidatus Micrarchaeota archaeon]|nr:MAG: hypothetical protein DRN67_01170 [Candidatus Micrarchaeota archaeon]